MTSLPSDNCQRCGNELRDDEDRHCDWCQLTIDEEEW